MVENMDVLRGYAEIGAYVRTPKNQVKHLSLRGVLPVFKMGRIVCARKATLDQWMTEQEAKARGALIDRGRAA